ncbi:MAG: hypothetical protein ABIP68_07495, partial [Ferruginibacter sp.]
MKHLNFIFFILLISSTSFAQGNNNGKSKGKDKHKIEKKQDKVYHKKNGNSSKHGYSNHQPKKVTAALLRDYPHASNIRWSKYKCDYTATFNNGIFKSTAVYHANGDRRDTRTVLTRAQLPGTIWDKIFRRDNITPTEYIQIERPSTIEKIFRVLSSDNNAYYYDL